MFLIKKDFLVINNIFAKLTFFGPLAAVIPLRTVFLMKNKTLLKMLCRK